MKRRNIMEIKDMKLEEVEARMSELDSMVETSESTEEIAKATEERALLAERKAELESLESRKAMAQEIDNGAKAEVVEERKEENKMVKIEEYRNSKEYVDAFAEYIKTGKTEEIRSLLTTNVGASGTVAVPDSVYDIVKTAWEKSDIMALVRKLEVAGNMKVQFEISGSDAVIHNEGSGAVSEETLSLGIVTLVPESIKKWVAVSDEVLDMRGQAFLDYIYDELTYKIAKKAESVLIGKIAALDTTASTSAPYAKKVKAGAAVGTIAKALGQLSDEATNPVIVMNKATWASFKAAQYGAGYSIDPFEGLPVYFTSALPALTDANENAVYAIVGDFGFGALANFPNGDGVEIKVDDKTDMKSDLVNILGREYIAVEPIACGAFVNITAPAVG
jgi:HK97 family phage major capsid protein